MKIAHISDLHLTTIFKENNLDNIELTLQYLNEINIDHLAITGDLTDNAETKDFFLLRNLFEKYGFLHSERLSIVAGNHDIFGGVQKAEDIFTFPEKCRIVNYNNKLIEFYNFFPEAFQNCRFFSPEKIFPYCKIINGVLIVGINSIAEYSKVKNPFASNGKIDLQQFFDISEILEKYNSYKHKLVLIHHHFNKIKINPQKSSNSFWLNIEKQTMKLRKKKRLLNIFKQYGVELVLHGHYHDSTEYTRQGIRFSNAGASFKGFNPDEIKINMITLRENNLEIEIHKLKTSNVTSIPIREEKIINTELKIAAA